MNDMTEIVTPDVPRPFIRKHQVTYHDPRDVKCVVLAKAGMSTEAIMRITGYSKGKVLYRTGKGELLEYGRDKKTGRKVMTYRGGWRMGVSPEARMFLTVMLPKVRQQVVRTLPQLVEAIPYAQNPKV